MEDGGGGGEGGFVEFDVPEFSNAVLKQLNELRLQGKLCDIIVHIQGRPFRAHKAVLAASSPYFRDHSALGTMSGLSLSVIKSPAVFEQLLAFCYTGHMELHLRDVVSFLTAASFLQMQAVIDKCTQILEGLHSKISRPLPGTAETDDELECNGDKEAGTFLYPTQISPPYYPRKNQRGEASKTGRGFVHLVEDGQLDRGSSDCTSEQEALPDAEPEQVDLIDRNGQVTDVHVKLEKVEHPSYSDSSSAGDDGYNTELVDGEQVLAVTVGSSGSVMPSSRHSYPGLPSSCYLSIGAPAASRSVIYQNAPSRLKRPASLPADLLPQLKSTIEDGDAMPTGPSFENDMRERGLRSQWYSLNERLVCVYCGKSFNQKGSLDRHMRLHMGITPFVCKYCGKKYTRKDQLEYHIRGHTDNKPFNCQICGKCFPFQGTLNQHLRKKHMSSNAEINSHAPVPSEGHVEGSEPECKALYADDTPASKETAAKCSPEGDVDPDSKIKMLS